MPSFIRAIALCAIVCSLFGCEADKNSRYADEKETETVTIGFGRTDVHQCVKTLFNKFMKVDPKDWSPPGKARPFIAVRDVKNFSDEHVDTKLVTDLLEEELLNSGVFRFTTAQEDKKKLLDEVDEQSDSGMVKQNERTAKRGNWNPPEYLLTGRFSTLRKKQDGVEDVYFVFVLNLDDINSATTVWTGTREIVKIKEQAGFGY